MKLYNTLSGQVEEFVPADANLVKMYVCGVTPYSATHVGHALSYVVFDTLRRYLEYKGYEVRHVQNFTDIDDKIIQRAQESGVSEDELVEEFIGDYFQHDGRPEHPAGLRIPPSHPRDSPDHRRHRRPD